MSEDVGASRNAREQLHREIAGILAEQVPDMAGAQRLGEFCGNYFRHADASPLLRRPAAQIAAGVLRHVGLGRMRPPGTSPFELFTPDPQHDGWDADGHTVLALVADDKAWLVDTVTLAVEEQGWALRELVHPQLHVVRDPQGALVEPGAPGGRVIAESWIWMELYPPLGASADRAMPALARAVAASLADLDAVTADFPEMRRLVLEGAELAARSGHPEAAGVAEMLRWLSDDRFVLLGLRDFDVVDGGGEAGQRFRPRPGGLGTLRDDERASAAFGASVDPGTLLVITKDSERSRVRRANHPDYLGLWLHDDQGRRFERRVLGLFTQAALAEPVWRIPVLRDKADRIASAIGYDPDSYGGRAVAAAIEAHPRTELLQADVAELTPIIAEVAELENQRGVLSFFRRAAWGRFLTALIYFPRERYNTAVRQRILGLLTQATGAESSQWSVQVSESTLARLYVTLKMPSGVELPLLDPDELRPAIAEATRDWEERFIDLAEHLDSSRRGVEWSEAYRQAYSPAEAIDDLLALDRVGGPDDMAQTLYTPEAPENGVDVRLKILRVGSEMVLSQVLPHLSSLGVDIVDERPFDIELRGTPAHVYDFGLHLPDVPERLDGWPEEEKARFVTALAASFVGLSEPDGLNRLITDAGLTWQQVSVLRAVSRYLRQVGTTYSQPYIAQALHRQRRIARRLVALFEARFDPRAPGDEARQDAVERLRAEVLTALDDVTALDEDRILRQFLGVIGATVRTNYYALDNSTLPSGTPRPGRGALALKLDPGALDFVTTPQPEHEIFVCSPQVEGVHLRYGRVARGGIRWSDRAEDYRTEVMGLVKAQMVKNAIIVPVGAKGGFHPLRLAGLDGPAREAEGRAGYAAFIRALLSVTDDLRGGHAVRPDKVVALDGDDPYLVVAADKGTASFSDLANRISHERGFWLGDAFASGGSEGYDHKVMGITARGAWVSAIRHFAEMGIDCQRQDFTCVGIGDMSGDVFGNGMLMSRHTRLVAAFDHRHIFLDPNPDPETSYAERERLFRLDRSSWDDYRREAISAGGGVYGRKVKSIPISGQVREALGLGPEITELTPNQVIQAILRAPVDLMWNGGIGTWVKAGTQPHSAAGDRANDAVRVDANQVRAKAVVEGGNLGWTQAARVEYARVGGRINTDFIDNSAGVSTSDYEVNIKILLDAEVAGGRLAPDDRNDLLRRMTDEVTRLVLDQNVGQNRALADALYDAPECIGYHEDLMASLEAAGYVHRALDGLPSTAEISERTAAGRGLVAPELCTLLATAKIALADELLASDLPDDPYLADRLVKYFPSPLRERFADRMPSHPLARQIITTVAVNRFVDSQGIVAAHRLGAETGAGAADVVRAQLAARNLLDAGWLETRTAKSDLPAAVKTTLRVRIRDVVERGTRWLLHEQGADFDIDRVVGELKPGVREAMKYLPRLMGERHASAASELAAEGVPAELAGRLSAWPDAHLALPIVRVASRCGRDVATTAEVYYRLGAGLGIDETLRAAEGLPRNGRWEIMARAAIRDELINAQETVTAAALTACNDPGADADRIVDTWWEAHPRARDQRTLMDEASAGQVDLARVSVAAGSLRALLGR